MTIKYISLGMKNSKIFSLLLGTMLLFVLPINLAHAANSPSSVNLGTAGNFVILAKSGISTTGTTSIVGNIGVSPVAATGITGFGLVMDASNQFATSLLVNGSVYASDYASPTPSVMTTAIGDMETAYTDAAGRVNGTGSADYTGLGAGNIGGMNLTPGIYKWTTGVTIPTDLTLDCQGNTSAVFIFQIAGTLDINSGKQVILTNGCLASNIFWQVAGQTTLGTTSVFNGNILDQTAIVLQTGATLNGRALAQTAVTLDSNKVSLLPNACILNTASGCMVCNQNGTAWIDNSSMCSSGQVCRNGTCTTNCTNDCNTSGQKQCIGAGYQTCGNYDSDSCLEWSVVTNCSANQTCLSGTCITNCTSHSVKKCFDNDMYWFNSCNVKEGLYMDCGNSINTANYRCNGNWTQRQTIAKGCLNSTCYNTTVWNNVQNCASTGKTCLNGSCITCIPNQTQGCRVCNINGTAWIDNSSMCSIGQVCKKGTCVANCTNECDTLGQTKCSCTSASGFQTCGNYDSDLCLEWSNVTACPAYQTCSNGICSLKANNQSCSASLECLSGNCNNGFCCDTGSCGWLNGTKGMCIANGSTTPNSSLEGMCGRSASFFNGICRSGTWKIVYGGMGCNLFACDSGNCTNNFCLNTTNSTNTTKTIQAKITAGKWDAYEKNGVMSISASILPIGKDCTKVYRSGYIFTNLTVPKGANIISAKLLLPYNWRSGANANTILYGEATDNSLQFSTVPKNITNRLKTSSSVVWNNLPSTTWGKFITSPDISSIVREVTNRTGWTSGNSIAILHYEAANATNIWEAVSYEGCGGGNCTAILQVQYSS